jgi:multicomponent Na+:H+ antiporter subunit A
VLIALLVWHGVVGVAAFVAGGKLGRRGFAVAAAAPLAMLAWLATELGGVLDGGVVAERVQWVPALGIEVAVRLDGFGALMVLVVSVIGLAVLAYSWWYFAPSAGHETADTEDSLDRLPGLLTLFAGAMLGIVVADDLISMFTAWELTSITSYLLIGVQHSRSSARAAALQALLVTSAGGLAMLAGLVLVGQAAGTFSMSEILADPPAGTAVTVGIVCIAVGAFTKSAQYPFHFWLPGAMAAPTPVSAYLHSATMVKAGVYVLGRFAPVFAVLAPWRPLVLTVGLVTMIAGGLRAMRQYDLKLLLAQGTVSQLGFLVVLFGAGVPAATEAGVVLLLAHALFKAMAFMVVGIVDHQAGTRDVRLLPPLLAGWGATKLVAIISAASMAGVPLLLGFIAKEAAYTAFTDGPFGSSGLVLAGIVVGSTFTVAYSARFLWGLFLLPERLAAGTAGVTVPHPDREDGSVGSQPSPPAPPVWFLTPAILLGAASVVTGIAPALLDRLVGAATGALDPRAGTTHLAVWHGFNAALGLTALTFAAGAVLFLARQRVSALLARGAVLPSGAEVYLFLLQGLNRLANRVTAVVQNGTLPIYAGVVLVTAAVLPGAVLIRSVEWPGWPDFVGHPAQIPITVVLIGGALMASIVRRRFTAVLFLSTVGYGMAALFVIQGAPDLALTQAAIETLSTVLFVLVLRKLPDRFERRSSPFTRSVRVVIAVAVALTVFAFDIVARQARRVPPVSTEMVDRALPDAEGRNVVNVILVDFRGADTLGEITVLVAAAIGAVALARAGRRPRRAQPEPAGEVTA